MAKMIDIKYKKNGEENLIIYAIIKTPRITYEKQLTAAAEQIINLTQKGNEIIDIKWREVK